MQNSTYKLDKNTCVFPEEVSEGMAFATLGTLQKELLTGEITELSFENTCWVDIAPLLFLGVLIGNSVKE